MIPRILCVIVELYSQKPQRSAQKMKYETIWSAVDNLAKALSMTPSGLAKKSGLDSTTFNRSKRIRPDGKKRWPSLDSINKVLEYCNISFEEFYNYGDNYDGHSNIQTIPFARLSNNVIPSYQEDNAPDTTNWESIAFPIRTNSAYALEIDTNEYEPVYKKGSTVLLLKNSEIRHGDRIAVFFNDGSKVLAEFMHRKPQTIELLSLKKSENEISVKIDDIAYINRIVWVSQ